MKKFLVLLLLIISSFTYSQSVVFSYSKTVVENSFTIPTWTNAFTSIIIDKDNITINEGGYISRFYIINVNSYNPVSYETLYNGFTFTIVLEPDRIVIKNGRNTSQILFKVNGYY